MIETLVPINLPPGLYRNGTRLDASGRWYDGNLMRWVEGKPQPIGGWASVFGALSTDSSTGVYRACHPWRTSTDLTYIAVGSNHRLTVVRGSGGQVIMSSVQGLTTGQKDAALIGSGATLGVDEADTWQLDNFGDTLVAVFSADGRLFSWAPPFSSGSASVVTGAPISNIGVVVTPERFVVVLGAGGDVRKVQWPDQETLTTWTPTADNQAGDFTLATNGRLMCGTRSKSQTLLWTDGDLWSMNYIGGSLVYGFQQEGDHCGIISKKAYAVVETQAFWMGRNAFYKYDGFVQPIPCDVRDYVFEDFNSLQASKVWSMTIAEFNEVWWFYCSANSTEIDRYVTYNYRDGHWHFGNMARFAGADAGVTPRPIMLAHSDNSIVDDIFEHETGEDRDGETPYLESGPVTLDKDRVMRIQRIVPDISPELGDANVSVYTSMFPTESETLNGPYSLANPTDVRLSAKHVRLRVEEADDVSWRVGTIQLGVIPQGRR